MLPERRRVFLSFIYQDRKRPREHDKAEAERSETSAPYRSALSSGQAAPPPGQKDGGFDLEAAMKAKMERAFGDLSAVKLYQSESAAGIGAGAMSGREDALASAGGQPYTGPVTHALSSAAPSPSAAGPMQARRGDSKPQSVQPAPPTAVPAPKSKIRKSALDLSLDDPVVGFSDEKDDDPAEELDIGQFSDHQAASQDTTAEAEPESDQSPVPSTAAQDTTAASSGQAPKSGQRPAPPKYDWWSRRQMLEDLPWDERTRILMKWKANPDLRWHDKLGLISEQDYFDVICQEHEEYLAGPDQDKASRLQNRVKYLEKRNPELHARAMAGVSRMAEGGEEKSLLSGRVLETSTSADDFFGVKRKKENGNGTGKGKRKRKGKGAGIKGSWAGNGNRKGKGKGMKKGKRKWRGTYEEWKSGLTKDEKVALERYTYDYSEYGEYHPGNYIEVNTPLRLGVNMVAVPGEEGQPSQERTLNPDEIEALDKQRADMDSAIEKFELKKPIVVTRKSRADLIGGLTEPDEIMERYGGRVVKDPGYLSTSTNPTPPPIDGEIIYRIAVPAGKGRGAYLEPMSAHQGEKEFLLKRNTEMVVIQAYKDKNGMTVVELQA